MWLGCVIEKCLCSFVLYDLLFFAFSPWSVVPSDNLAHMRTTSRGGYWLEWDFEMRCVHILRQASRIFLWGNLVKLFVCQI